MSTSFGATETQGDVGMTLRAVISACCGVFVLLAPAQARGVECATEPQRKIEIEKLNESVDWFLSIVEEVPEGIARQFRAVKPRGDENAFRQAVTHPLWAAHRIRKAGADIKRELRPRTPDTPEANLRGAIGALKNSAWFSVELSDYARGHRIINEQEWIRRYHLLPLDLASYAQCLVDLVSTGAGSGPPAAPR
jgi:hypothetical protein